MYKYFKAIVSLASLTLLIIQSVGAYEILPHDALKVLNNNPIHEAMTVSSFLCSKGRAIEAPNAKTDRVRLDWYADPLNLNSVG